MDAAKPSNPNPQRAVNGAGAPAGRPQPFPPTKAQQYRNPYRPQQPPARRRRHRRGCCCACCLWLTLLVIALIFLAAIAAGVFYVLYHPQRPSFTVSSFRLAALNLTAADLLTARLDLTVTARNPNRKLAFVYGDVSIAASTAGVPIAQGTVPGFVQDAGNTTVVKATAKSTGVSLDPADASDLRKKKRYPLVVEIETMAGVRIGGFKSKRIAIQASCSGVEVAVAKGNATASADGSAAKCKVRLRIKIWNWTI